MNLDLMAEILRIDAMVKGWTLPTLDDWEGKYRIPADLALIHSELSEALEEFREDNLERFLVEMADVQIRLLCCIGGLTKEFDKIVWDKIKFDRTRKHRHGGKKI